MSPYEYADFVAITATNDAYILRECLMKSPDIETGRLRVITIENASSMARAYNEAISKLTNRVCLLVHQDVYLPSGWLDRALESLNYLEEVDPAWKIAGPYGVEKSGTHVGRVWDVTLGRELGAKNFKPTAIHSLDELLIIYRNDGPPVFDDALPDFHLYGTDVVQIALAHGRSSYAVELPVVHNNRPIASLSGGYSRAYKFMADKWRKTLPINTAICQLSLNPLPLWRARWRRRHVKARPERLLADAVAIAKLAGYE